MEIREIRPETTNAEATADKRPRLRETLPGHRLLELWGDGAPRVAVPRKPSTAGKLKTPCAKSRAQEGGKVMAQPAPVTISVVTPQEDTGWTVKSTGFPSLSCWTRGQL